MLVLSQETERSCICVLGVSSVLGVSNLTLSTIFYCTLVFGTVATVLWSLGLLPQCGIFCLFIILLLEIYEVVIYQDKHLIHVISHGFISR